jgi:hypothetical protein
MDAPEDAVQQPAAPIGRSRPKVHPEFVNLAEEMEEEDLKALAERAIEEYEADMESRSEWSNIHEFFAKLYYQTDYAVTSQTNEDRSWGSTESIPVLTEAVNQFASRSSKGFFGNRDFVSVLPVSLGKLKDGEELPDLATAREMMKEVRDQAKRVAKHMNYQLTVENTNYRLGKKAVFIGSAIHGSHFVKTYWDVELNRPACDNVRAVDLVVPYNVGPIDIEKVPRKTHRIFTNRLATEMLKRRGFYMEAAEPLDNLDEVMSEVDKAAAEQDGLSSEQNNATKDNHAEICLVLEQHRFWEIPDPQSKKDAAAKLIVPVIVWVDYASRKVLRLAIRYETDAAGTPTDDRKPIEFFTHYKFFENVDGFYGYGLGHLIGNLNASGNIMLRQTIDAATLMNDGNMSGFISNRMTSPDEEEVALELGKFKPVPDNVENIQQGIYQFKFPGPSEALAKLMQYMVEYGQRLGGSTEAVTGTVDKVLQPTTLSMLLEQGLEMPSSVMMDIAIRMGDELQKIFRLNRLYLDERVLFVVDDEVEEVNRTDYEGPLRINPVFDAKQATKAQQVAMAQAELQATTGNPNSATRPQVFDVAFRRYLLALGAENIDELIPPPAEPLQMDDQRQENAMFLMPGHPPIGVFPDQDHAAHLAEIDMFMQTPFAAELSPEAAQELLNHRQQHMAHLYAQQNGVTLDGEIGIQGPAQGTGPQRAGAEDFGGLVPPLPGLAGMAGPDMGAAAAAGGTAASAGGFDQAAA